jgi:hypothetical protein
MAAGRRRGRVLVVITTDNPARPAAEAFRDNRAAA